MFRLSFVFGFFKQLILTILMRVNFASLPPLALERGASLIWQIFPDYVSGDLLASLLILRTGLSSRLIGLIWNSLPFFVTIYLSFFTYVDSLAPCDDGDCHWYLRYWQQGRGIIHEEQKPDGNRAFIVHGKPGTAWRVNSILVGKLYSKIS